MMGERATASRAGGDDNLAAMAREKPDRRLVDLRRENLLRATIEKRNATGPLALALEHLRLIGKRSARQPRGDERERGFQLCGEKPSEWRAQARQPHRCAKQVRIRQDDPESAPQQPIEPRPLVRLLDMAPSMIDEVHVVYARRAGRHAGEAREAAVDVLDHLGRGRAIVLQHVLDEVDATSRAIELVAEQGHKLGRSRCRTRNARRRAGSFRMRWCPGRRVERR